MGLATTLLGQGEEEVTWATGEGRKGIGWSRRKAS